MESLLHLYDVTLLSLGQVRRYLIILASSFTISSLLMSLCLITSVAALFGRGAYEVNLCQLECVEQDVGEIVDSVVGVGDGASFCELWVGVWSLEVGLCELEVVLELEPELLVSSELLLTVLIVRVEETKKKQFLSVGFRVSIFRKIESNQNHASFRS